MNNVYQVPLPKWVRLSKYSEMSGMTENAFNIKKSRGLLIEGVHWKSAPDGKTMVDWRMMDDWVENGCRDQAS